ncbi:DUF3854 domain-containing protein [Nostoc sp. UIC 10607]|uniref:DUF3854 domain-containing protein n=1 Tax=Nostoc sp. UIC 10607 TaxID=3045935 RepID=UPI0039A0661F
MVATFNSSETTATNDVRGHLDQLTLAPLLSEPRNQATQPNSVEQIWTNESVKQHWISFDAFKDFIKQKFGRDRLCAEQFDAMIEFTDSPHRIAEALRWKKPYSGVVYAALMLNADGSVWHSILSLPNDDGTKPYKRLAPSKNGDQCFYPRVVPTIRRLVEQQLGLEKGSIPDDVDFYEWLANSELPVITTEGSEKLFSLICLGYPATTNYGATCGVDKKTKRFKPSLQRIMNRPRTLLVAYDMDSKPSVVASVNKGIDALSYAAQKVGSSVSRPTWDESLGKGIDDLLLTPNGETLWAQSYNLALCQAIVTKMLGIGAVDEVNSFEQLEQVFQLYGTIVELNILKTRMSADNLIAALNQQIRELTHGKDAVESKSHQSKSYQSKSKLIPADILAFELAEDYLQRLKYCNEYKEWKYYLGDDSGLWKSLDDHMIETMIQGILDARSIVGYGTDSYIVNIRKFMARRLTVETWPQRTDIVPFLDGVLVLATGKFEKHSPANYLTWTLPHRFDNPSLRDWPTIRGWFQEVTEGDSQKIQTLICFAAATLRGMSHLQKILYLWGNGGNGKGIYSDILQALVGSENTWSGKIENLDNPNFLVDINNKRSVIFEDQDKVNGGLQTFKTLTGGGSTKAKEVYKKACDVRLAATVLITSNYAALQGSGVGRWLKRRLIVVNMNYCPPIVDTHLREKLYPEIGAFTQYLLTIPESEIINTLNGKNSTGYDLAYWEMAQMTDSIAAWVERHIVRDPSGVVKVGSNKNEWQSSSYRPEISTLFGSYHHYCQNSGQQGKSLPNFTPDLLQVLNHVLGWSDVKQEKTRTGSHFYGIRLRGAFDEAPFPSESSITSNQAGDSAPLWGVGGRVWGVGKETEGASYPSQCKHPYEGGASDPLVVGAGCFPTPHTLHPTPAPTGLGDGGVTDKVMDMVMDSKPYGDGCDGHLQKNLFVNEVNNHPSNFLKSESLGDEKTDFVESLGKTLSPPSQPSPEIATTHTPLALPSISPNHHQSVTNPSPAPSASVTTRQPVKGDRVKLLSSGKEYKISWVSCGSDKVLLVSARTGQPLTAPSPLRPGAAAGGLNLIDVSELEFLDT